MNGIAADDRVITKSDHKHAHGVLLAVLERFSEQIRSDEKHFDAASSWVDVALVKQSELGDLRLDDREWGDYEVQEDESDAEDEADNGAPVLDDNNDNDNETAPPVPLPASSAKSKKPPAGSKCHPKLAATKKLRPATDILNRLRWDPSLDSSDHVIGYEDRFLGVREMALDRWKTEQTDEEFIPQHRILYFRRRSDGVVVWERETRRDEIFGSGAGRAA